MLKIETGKKYFVEMEFYSFIIETIRRDHSWSAKLIKIIKAPVFTGFKEDKIYHGFAEQHFVFEITEPNDVLKDLFLKE